MYPTCAMMRCLSSLKALCLSILLGGMAPFFTLSCRRQPVDVAQLDLSWKNATTDSTLLVLSYADENGKPATDSLYLVGKKGKLRHSFSLSPIGTTSCELLPADSSWVDIFQASRGKQFSLAWDMALPPMRIWKGTPEAELRERFLKKAKPHLSSLRQAHTTNDSLAIENAEREIQRIAAQLIVENPHSEGANWLFSHFLGGYRGIALLIEEGLDMPPDSLKDEMALQRWRYKLLLEQRKLWSPLSTLSENLHGIAQATQPARGAVLLACAREQNNWPGFLAPYIKIHSTDSLPRLNCVQLSPQAMGDTLLLQDTLRTGVIRIQLAPPLWKAFQEKNGTGTGWLLLDRNQQIISRVHTADSLSRLLESRFSRDSLAGDLP